VVVFSVCGRLYRDSTGAIARNTNSLVDRLIVKRKSGLTGVRHDGEPRLDDFEGPRRPRPDGYVEFGRMETQHWVRQRESKQEEQIRKGKGIDTRC